MEPVLQYCGPHGLIGQPLVLGVATQANGGQVHHLGVGLRQLVEVRRD